MLPSPRSPGLDPLRVVLEEQRPLAVRVAVRAGLPWRNTRSPAGPAASSVVVEWSITQSSLNERGLIDDLVALRVVIDAVEVVPVGLPGHVFLEHVVQVDAVGPRRDVLRRSWAWRGRGPARGGPRRATPTRPGPWWGRTRRSCPATARRRATASGRGRLPAPRRSGIRSQMIARTCPFGITSISWCCIWLSSAKSLLPERAALPRQRLDPATGALAPRERAAELEVAAADQLAVVGELLGQAGTASSSATASRRGRRGRRGTCTAARTARRA